MQRKGPDLLALKDFVSAAPQIVSNGTREDYLMKLGEYLAVRRDRLIKLLNDSKILPAKVVAPVIPPFQAPLKKGQVSAALLNSALDAADKFATWTMSEHIRIPRKFGLTPLAMLEGWCKAARNSPGTQRREWRGRSSWWRFR
jgi:hypothetical protein